MTSRSLSDPKRNGESGFSLIGLVMIMVAMGAMFAVIFVAVAPTNANRSANLTVDRATALEKAIKLYKANSGGTAPANLDQLVLTTGVACAADTNTASPTYRKLVGWCGPYVDRPVAGAPNEFKTDGWGTVFQYTGTQIKSCGPNLTCGNGDDLTFTSF